MTTIDTTSVPDQPARQVGQFKPDLLQSGEHDLCPGCGHPVAWRLVLDVIAELGLSNRSILIAGHGCYTQMMRLSDLDSLQCLHGRAPAVATGVKRMVPDTAVFTLQGDGDMVSEGLHEVLHAAARGEQVTALLFNNGVFGDTGGHLTATTGSACTAGVAEPSHVLLAMGADDSRARGSLRFSLGHTSTQPDVDALGRVIHEVVDRARRAAAR